MSGAFSVRAYVLMTNHIHMIVVPFAAPMFSRAMGVIHGRNAEYFNRKYGFSGHLWDFPYDSSVIGDDEYLHNAVRYVEQNPVRARMVELAQRYTSAPFHCGLTRHDLILDTDCPLVGVIPDWKSWLACEVSEADQTMIKDRLSRGLPYASESARKRLEKAIRTS